MTPSLLLQEKKQIADSFSHAAEQYDQVARLQKQVAQQVCSEFGTVSTDHQILDLGCGTADIYSYFATKPNYTGLDISSGMLAKAENKFGSHISLVKGDAELLPFANAQFDHIVSSLALQWCDLSKVLAEAYRVLKPGGQLVFSTLLDGTLEELNSAWRKVDVNRHINQFMTSTELMEYLDINLWHNVSVKKDTIALDYPNVLSVMRELKGIGANHVIGRDKAASLTKQKLKALELHYPAKHDLKYVTWQVAYITLTK